MSTCILKSSDMSNQFMYLVFIVVMFEKPGSHKSVVLNDKRPKAAVTASNKYSVES